jgi:transposase
MKFGQRLGLGVGYGARLGTDGFTEQGDDARIQPIARGTGMDRKTIAGYLRAAQAVGVQPGGGPPTDEQLTAITTTRRPGRPSNTDTPSPEVDALRPQAAQIRAWLSEGLRLTKTVSYSSLYRFARAACDFGAPAITVRVAEPPPGEAAEVDFGRLGVWQDPIAGRRRTVYGLLVTLCFSRYAFIAISLRQNAAAVINGLESAWVFFGGVVKRLVEDNLKPVVTRPDRYAPTIDRGFLEYAQYRGFVVDPAVVHHATGKPKVERGIPYCRQDFFRGETFCDLAEMQARAVAWCRDIAGTRVHGTTRQVPRVVFETVEQPRSCPWRPSHSIGPRGRRPRCIPIITSSSAGPSTRWRPAISAPVSTSAAIPASCGSTTAARSSRSIRSSRPGGRSTDYTDYPADRAAYAMRAPTPASGRPSRSAQRSASSCACCSAGSSPGRACAKPRSCSGSPPATAPRASTRPVRGPWPSSCSTSAGSSASSPPPSSASPAPPSAAPSAPCPRASPAPRRASPIPRRRRSPMDLAPDLVRRLKRLRLGGLLPTLPDRVTHARQTKLAPLEFLELLLQDEIDRRDSQGLTAASRPPASTRSSLTSSSCGTRR